MEKFIDKKMMKDLMTVVRELNLAYQIFTEDTNIGQVNRKTYKWDIK